MNVFKLLSPVIVTVLIAALFAGVVTVPAAAATQAPPEQWNKTYGGFWARAAKQTTDGGYILAADSRANGQ